MPGLTTDEIERRSRGKARALSCPLAMRTYRTGAKALPCQSRADDDYGWFSPKPCGLWLWLGRTKAVRTMAMAGSRQSRADDDYGWFSPKPCGRWLWLGRAKGVRTMTMAGSRQSRADDDYSWVAPKPCGRAERPGGRG